MIIGTDAGINVIKPHDVLPYAIAQAAEVAMGPLAALRMATATAAAACGLAAVKGRLAPGYDADILAIDGDPLTDPAALRRVRAVFARGNRIDR